MSFTLYELNNIYLNIIDLIEDGAEPDVVDSVLLNINEELEHKADSYAIVIKNLEAKAGMIKAEEKRLSDRRRSIENNIKNMKSRLEESMILQDKKKFKTDKFSFGIQKNPMSVKIIDENSISEDYKEIVETVKVDKKAILEAYKQGQEIKGVEVNQTESLRIR